MFIRYGAFYSSSYITLYQECHYIVLFTNKSILKVLLIILKVFVNDKIILNELKFTVFSNVQPKDGSDKIILDSKISKNSRRNNIPQIF